MPEGVKEADSDAVIVAVPIDQEPAPDPETAPHGWVRDKAQPTGWRPRSRARRGSKARRSAETDAGDVGDVGDADHDPDPSWWGQDSPKQPYEASEKERDDIAGLLALAYSIPADFLITVDPYCFGALNAQLGSVIDATVPIICRSESAVRWMTGKSGVILWAQLAMALKPIIVAMWQHHVIHSVQLLQSDETGEVVVVHSDFSAYTAA